MIRSQFDFRRRSPRFSAAGAIAPGDTAGAESTPAVGSTDSEGISPQRRSTGNNPRQKRFRTRPRWRSPIGGLELVPEDRTRVNDARFSAATRRLHLEIRVQESVEVKHRCLASRSVYALLVNSGVESRLDSVTDLDVFLLNLVGRDQ